MFTYLCIRVLLFILLALWTSSMPCFCLFLSLSLYSLFFVSVSFLSLSLYFIFFVSVSFLSLSLYSTCIFNVSVFLSIYFTLCTYNILFYTPSSCVAVLLSNTIFSFKCASATFQILCKIISCNFYFRLFQHFLLKIFSREKMAA
jgi:hypothetical protein